MAKTAKVALVEAPPPDAAPTAPARGGKRKLFVILGVLLVLAGGGGFAAWSFMAPKGAEHPADKTVAELPPVFMPVEQFTVNLNPEGGEQFLQTAFTLKVTDQEVVDSLKARAPDLRNQVLLLLSSKKAAELSTVEGKQKLAAEIMATANEVMLPAFPALKKAAEARAAAEAKAAAAKAAEAKALETAAGDAKPADAQPADAKPAETKPAVAKTKDGERAKSSAPAHAVTGVLFTHFIIQ